MRRQRGGETQRVALGAQVRGTRMLSWKMKGTAEDDPSVPTGTGGRAGWASPTYLCGTHAPITVKGPAVQIIESAEPTNCLWCCQALPSYRRRALGRGSPSFPAPNSSLGTDACHVLRPPWRQLGSCRSDYPVAASPWTLCSRSIFCPLGRGNGNWSRRGRSEPPSRSPLQSHLPRPQGAGQAWGALRWGDWKWIQSISPAPTLH